MMGAFVGFLLSKDENGQENFLTEGGCIRT